MHENTLQKTGACTLRCNGVFGVYNYRHVTSLRVVTSQLLTELKNDLQCSLFQVWKCGSEGCNIRNLDADGGQIGLEVYRQHIAANTSGMELAQCEERRDG